MGGSYEGNEAGAIYNPSFLTVHIAGAVPVDQAGSDQRLEVLPGR